jgi:sterol desaturase/sphingolipid hydroxylase (fatty acid hydroxylase superfamily)
MSETTHPATPSYRPRPVRLAPLFRRPLRLVPILKYVFGFPGYLWPWSLLLFGIAWLVWYLAAPPLTESWSVGAVTLLLTANAVTHVLFVGVWHLRLYVQRSQGTEYKYDSRWPSTNDSTFLFRNQVWDNVLWNLCSAVPIATCYQLVTLWMQANGVVPTVSWQAHPVYCVTLALIVPAWIAVHFYATHRVLHWKPLYRSVHYLHHKNINPCPWSGVAMHPLEHVLYFSAVALFWIVPSHPLHGMYLLISLLVGPAISHSGFDRIILRKGISIPLADYMHQLHHKYVQANYGTGLVPFDAWRGTMLDGSDESIEALKARVRERALRSRQRQPSAAR